MNGVIIITTKQGKAGKTRIELDIYTSFQQPAKKLELKNAQEFAQFVVDGRNNGYTDKKVRRGASAIVALNMPLPTVKVTTGQMPFVVATKHKNGTVGIATLPRTTKEKGIFAPLLTVQVTLAKNSSIMGLFGKYGQLQLNFSTPVKNIQVLAQYLASDKVVYITKQLKNQGIALVIPGKLI